MSGARFTVVTGKGSPHHITGEECMIPRLHVEIRGRDDFWIWQLEANREVANCIFAGGVAKSEQEAKEVLIGVLERAVAEIRERLNG